MRTVVLAACSLLLLGSSAFGQGIDLKVHLRTGETVTIPGSDICRIAFTNVTLGVDPALSGTTRGALQSLRSYPNPFRPSTTIEFQLAASADVRVRVFDLKGAVVRELLNGTVSAGRHEVAWDGTDRNHAPVASGVYFYRVECGLQSASRRLVLVK